VWQPLLITVQEKGGGEKKGKTKAGLPFEARKKGKEYKREGGTSIMDRDNTAQKEREKGK